MRVTGVDVKFRRTRQPAQYETAEAEVAFHVAVDEIEADGVDPAEAAREWLGLAADAVYERLGLNVTLTLPGVASSDEAKPAKRTRRTKAQMDADALAAEAAKSNPTGSSAAAAPAGAAQSAGGPASAQSQNVADMTGGSTAPPAQTPASAAALVATPGEQVVSDQELQAKVSATAKRLGSATLVKALIAEFGAPRVGEIAKDKRAEFCRRLDALKIVG